MSEKVILTEEGKQELEKKLEYLKIYSEGMEVRKSAWVQKEVKNEALA